MSAPPPACRRLHPYSGPALPRTPLRCRSVFRRLDRLPCLHLARQGRPGPDGLSPLWEFATALRGVVSPRPSAEAVDHQTDHSLTLRSNTPPEWVVWCTLWCTRRSRCVQCLVALAAGSCSTGSPLATTTWPLEHRLPPPATVPSPGPHRLCW